MRAYTKALPVISKEEGGVTPRFYLRCLVEVEDFVNEVWEDRDGRYVPAITSKLCFYCIIMFLHYLANILFFCGMIC